MSNPQILASSIEHSQMIAEENKAFNSRYVTLNEQSSHIIDREQSRSKTGLELRDSNG